MRAPSALCSKLIVHAAVCLRACVCAAGRRSAVTPANGNRVRSRSSDSTNGHAEPLTNDFGAADVPGEGFSPSERRATSPNGSERALSPSTPTPDVTDSKRRVAKDLNGSVYSEMPESSFRMVSQRLAAAADDAVEAVGSVRSAFGRSKRSKSTHTNTRRDKSSGRSISPGALRRPEGDGSVTTALQARDSAPRRRAHRGPHPTADATALPAPATLPAAATLSRGHAFAQPERKSDETDGFSVAHSQSGSFRSVSTPTIDHMRHQRAIEASAGPRTLVLGGGARSPPQPTPVRDVNGYEITSTCAVL